MNDGAGGGAAPPPEADVLVAGAGPVGLTLAYELLRRGVRVRIVDAAAGPAATSRATATHARTMEIFQQMGLLDRLLPRGQRVEHFSIHRNGRRLIRFDTSYAATPTRYPFSLMVDQVITEEVLRSGVRDLGGVIEWGVTLETLAQRNGGVRAQLRHAGGRTETYAVPWLVGADGAHSTVRRVLGLRLLGDSTQTWLNADLCLDAPLPRDSNHLLHLGSGTLLLVPFPEPGKWRVVDTADTGGADDPEAVRARLAGKISRALGRTVAAAAPTWVSVFTVQQRMIERMRVGRCFVAGDAAHVHSPASGQGMNAGIQDAYNLAWKLAAVVRGHARERLLDSYGAERVPIGAVLLGSTRTATALVSLRNRLAPVLLPAGLGFLRAARPLKRRIEAKMIRGFSALTVGYPDSPLSLPMTVARPGVHPGERVACDAESERGHAGWRELCAELTGPRWTLLGFGRGVGSGLAQVDRDYGAAVSVRSVPGPGPHPLPDPGGALATALGARPGDWLLIRPDGYLAAKGPMPGAAGLDAALNGLGLCPAARTVTTPGGADAHR